MEMASVHVFLHPRRTLETSLSYFFCSSYGTTLIQDPDPPHLGVGGTAEGIGQAPRLMCICVVSRALCEGLVLLGNKDPRDAHTIKIN